MYLSIWFGVMLSTQSGCSSSKKQDPAELAGNPPPATAPAHGHSRPQSYPMGRNLGSNAPMTPPAGARVSYSSIKTDHRVLAMTFDDGPHPSNTPRLLKMLRDRNIKATFYVVGKNAQAYPHLIRQMIAEGHEVGNHTWTHGSLTSMSDAQIRSELNRSNDAIFRAAGYRPRTVRPPYGAINTRIKNLMYAEYGYPTIMWSVDPQDWRKPGVSEVTRRLVTAAHNGAILLCHDIHSSTIDAMPSTFDQLLARGYRFVTVSQLMNIEKSQVPIGAVVRPALPADSPAAATAPASDISP